MNKSKKHKLIIIVLVLINTVTLFFLFKPHGSHHGKRPPSMTKMFAISGPSAKKIIALENHHFDLKTRLMDENASIRNNIYHQLQRGHKLAEMDALVSQLLVNQKAIEIETITFFVKIRKLIPDNKKGEVDEIINHVLSGRPGPPPRK